MSKYEPLSERLRSHSEDEWRASFSDLEQVLGFPLPKGARQGRSWWVNDPQKGHSRAWAGAGWEVGDIDPSAESVIFRRSAASAAVIQKVAHLEPLQAGAAVQPPEVGGHPAPPAAAEPAETRPLVPPAETYPQAAEDDAEEASQRSQKSRMVGMGALVAGAVAVVAGLATFAVRTVVRRRR